MAYLRASTSGPPKTFVASPYWATRRSVFFSPPPPIMIGTRGQLLNSPQSFSPPRVPIMIGGGGEKKTLRLVAQYGDATNVFGGPEVLARKYAILREHCQAVGRPYAEIERSTLQNTRLSASGGEGTESPEAAAARFDTLAELSLI